MKIPNKVPEKGFYYHYKHDPKGPLNNFAYEILNVGIHTEDDCRPEDRNMLIYRPLYEEASVYKAGGFWDLRPLDMFYESATKDHISVPRFRKITNPVIIAKLKKVREKMYGSE